jgi:symplekin
MNEEWYNDRIRMADDPDWVSAISLFYLAWFSQRQALQRPNYESWLNQIVSTYQTVLEGKPEGKPDSKDKAFARFLLDLPSVPPDVFDLLRDLSVDPDKCVNLTFSWHHWTEQLTGCTSGSRVSESLF